MMAPVTAKALPVTALPTGTLAPAKADAVVSRYR